MRAAPAVRRPFDGEPLAGGDGDKSLGSLRRAFRVARGVAPTGLGQLADDEPKLFNWMRYSRNGLPSGDATLIPFSLINK